MLSAIYSYELKYWLKKWITYFYFFVFFGFSLISFLGSGGYFDEPIQSDNSIRLLNSPHELNYLFQYLGKLLLFLLPAIIGNTIYKDFKYNVFPILYSFPMEERSYLYGKFLSGLTITLVIACAPTIAFMIGEVLLGSGSAKIGEFNLGGYFQAYFVFLIPNLIVFGVFVFGLVVLTRNIYSGFVLVILFFLIQLISESLFQGNAFLIAITDPFGQNATLFETQFWTLAQQNTELIPIGKAVIINRLSWLLLAFGAFFYLQRKFRLVHQGFQLKVKRIPKSNKLTSPNSSSENNLSSIRFDYSFKQQLRTIWKLSSHDFRYLVTNPMFYIFAILGILSAVFMLMKVTNGGEMIMLPLTRLMLAIPTFFYVTVTILITFIFSGMLVHRARLDGMDALVETSPVSNTILLFSKVLALIKVQYLLLLFLMLCGISIQLLNGFYSIDLSQYFFSLIILTALILFVWTLISVFIHTIVPNLYLGIFILLLLWLAKGAFSQIGITSNLLQLNSPPQLIYSDINGYGSQLVGYYWVQGFWIAFGGILLSIGYLFWRRERTFSVKERWKLALSRFKKPFGISVIILFLACSISGIFIFLEENKDTHLTSENSFENFQAKFEHFQKLPQPRITSLKLKIDLYPESNSFIAQGNYILINKTTSAIDTLLIKTGFDEMTSYSIKTKSKVIEYDSAMKFYVHLLENHLSPNDSIQLNFEISSKPNYLFQRNSSVLMNGTFLMQDILPRLGYSFVTQKKSPLDSNASNNHYQAIDSDLLDLETTISTSAGQIAIAPGVLQKQWEENGRNFFQFKSAKPIKMGFAFNSGEFEIREDKWRETPLDIYFHPTHDYVLDAMFEGLKAALAYNTDNFSEYQHQEIKIIEFPLTEGSFATSIANTLLISEARFGVNTESTDKIDLSFYVTAHELTHQWFGNQVIPKDVLGAVMLTESITEYVTLKVYEKEFGTKRALQFLEVQRLRYLKGRTLETGNESPLFLVKTEQDYISYGKGALAFHTISHYLGEERLNAVLKSLIQDYPAEKSLYPTSIDFLKKLRKITPDSLQYLIHDLFEKIIFHDAKIEKTSINKLDKSYEVNINFFLRKYGEVYEDVLPINDLIEIGIYDEDDNLIELKQLRVTQSKNTIKFNSKIKPSKVLLDPNLLLTDKNLNDNYLNF